ncbi:LysR family transcriptional regulator [Pectobacterium aroidearum]|nr:LysR family transcriptional regulator [Pectobacterium aroidearum]
MEFHHLRCFLAVAEELHFAKAAERLHVDQSPLSRTIKELEEELGAQLFVRTTRSTRLTRAGKLFLEHVPRVLLPYSRLKTVFRLPPTVITSKYASCYQMASRRYVSRCCWRCAARKNLKPVSACLKCRYPGS